MRRDMRRTVGWQITPKPAQSNLATDNTNWNYNDSGHESVDFMRHGNLKVNVLYVDSHVTSETKATFLPLWKVYQ